MKPVKLKKFKGYKKGELGTFQTFNPNSGDMKINNAFFNMSMGSSPAGEVSGVGAADGSVGAMSGGVAEGVESDTIKTKFNISVSDEDFDKVTTDEHYADLMDKNFNFIKQISSQNSQSKITDKDILTIVKEHFGTVDKPYMGPTFILPDGSILDLSKEKHHSVVEKFLIDSGLSTEEFIETAGSPTLSDLCAIRCDTQKYYIHLPHNSITQEQCNSLLLWLDMLADNCALVEVYTPNGEDSTIYRFDKDVVSDYIVDRIRRYYSSGKLFENQIKQRHQFDNKYERLPVGEKITMSNVNKKPTLKEYIENKKAQYDESLDNIPFEEIGLIPAIKEYANRFGEFTIEDKDYVEKELYLPLDQITEICFGYNENRDDFSELECYQENLSESAMSNLDLEIQEVGGKEKYIEEKEKELSDLENYVLYLNSQAMREIGKGGNFESRDEVEDSLSDTAKQINELKAKIEIAKRR